MGTRGPGTGVHRRPRQIGDGDSESDIGDGAHHHGDDPGGRSLRVISEMCTDLVPPWLSDTRAAPAAGPPILSGPPG